MSINLALKNGKSIIWDQVYQTPSQVSRDAIASKDPTFHYKDYVLSSSFGGKHCEESKRHFAFIDQKIDEGYQWITV
jgi:hypothetical protein